MTSAPEQLSAVREAVEAAGFTVDSAELTMVPKTTVEVADEGEAKKMLRLIDQLEDNDDVQDVYANFDIPEARARARRRLGRRLSPGRRIVRPPAYLSA